MVVDGIDGEPCAGVGDPVFSANSGRCAFLTKHGDGIRYFVDGSAATIYENGRPEIAFSSDGQHVAFAAKSAGRSWTMVIDGREYGEFTGFFPGSPEFRADGAIECLASREGILYRPRFVPGSSQE
jgi:hypothetical protein